MAPCWDGASSIKRQGRDVSTGQESVEVTAEDQLDILCETLSVPGRGVPA